MKLLLAWPLTMVLASGPVSARSTLPPAPASLRLELTSSDSARPLTMQIAMEGRPVSVGARGPTGAVDLSGNGGTITTPAVLEFGEGAAVVTLNVAASTPGVHLEIRPGTGRVERIAVPAGGWLRLVRDAQTGGISVFGDSLRTELRPQRRR